MNLSAPRLIAAVLVAGGAVLGVAAPALASSSAVSTGASFAQNDDDDDDDGSAPVGGVETGAGGTADDFDLLLPLGLAGGAALAGGIVLIRHRQSGQTD